MFDPATIVDLFLDNIKKLYFPEDWINFDLKFSKSELFTLLYITKRKEITMTELVEYINTPMSTATGIVDRLVKNGYVQRDRGETDRRVVILKLTAEGSRQINILKDVISNYIKTIIGDLTDEEMQFLKQLVFKILNNLQTQSTKNGITDSQIATVKKIEID